ncbi:MAG: hypothetical protein EXR77_01845 [Myxococcales bacterium]|nr:hypothetical protein [Myxococcales bacterium]
MALTAAGVAYEDIRLNRDQWLELKPSVPFGALPVLTDGNRRIAQSNAILGYIGRGHGLHPTDSWQAAEHEALMQSVEDLRAKLPDGKGQTPDEKKAAREAFAAGWLNQWAATVSAQIAGLFLAGPALNVADIKLYVIMRSMLTGTFDHIPAAGFDAFPKLVALHAAVDAHPAIHGCFHKA